MYLMLLNVCLHFGVAHGIGVDFSLGMRFDQRIRAVEFEQMEHQWFCKDGTDAEYYDSFKQKAWRFLLDLGFDEKHHLSFVTGSI